MRRLALAAALASAACGAPDRGPSAKALFVLPEFSLVEVGPLRDRPFGLADLKGRVWVADFVFTSCGGPCPLLSQRMSRLSATLPHEIGLLTVTVDPERDDSARLRAYARRYGADARWLFLRGDAKATYELLYAGFRLPISVDPSAPEESRATHSVKFVLIDKSGAIRGYYDGLSDSDNDALARDARGLLEVGS